MAKTDFNDLPNCLEQIYAELMDIKALLLKKEGVHFQKKQTQYLNVDQAISFLDAHGFKTPKSTLYKLTSTRQIPHFKFLGKLTFEAKGLLTWAEAQQITRL